jgi:hypothetical protein
LKLTCWFIQALYATNDGCAAQVVVSVLLFPYFTADRGQPFNQPFHHQLFRTKNYPQILLEFTEQKKESFIRKCKDFNDKEYHGQDNKIINQRTVG